MLDAGAAGRREVRYYLLNAAKPPLDDLNARKAVAMAIDRNQINQIRNNGVLPDRQRARSTPRCSATSKNPGFPKFNLKEAKKLASAVQGRARRRSSASCSSTPTTPPTSPRPRSSRSSWPRPGIDATLKQDDQTAFIIAAVSGNFSIMLWRQHPGDDPDAPVPVVEHAARSLNFGKFTDPTLQGLLDQGRTETDPAKRKTIYQQRQQALRDAGLQRVGLLRRTG